MSRVQSMMLCCQQYHCVLFEECGLVEGYDVHSGFTFPVPSYTYTYMCCRCSATVCYATLIIALATDVCPLVAAVWWQLLDQSLNKTVSSAGQEGC